MKSDAGFYWEGKKNVSFYETQFESYFIAKAFGEYDEKAKVKVADFTAPEYLKWADTCFVHEENYCDTMLQPETRSKLMTSVELVLITNRNLLICDKDTGVKYMIDNQRKDELLMLYKCFSRNESNLTVIVDCLNKYIEAEGAKIVNDTSNLTDPLAYTQKLLDFKEQIDELIIHSFNSNIKFEKGRDLSF
jgi:hypothetical protein